jgi:TolA-binding protein
MKHQVLLLMCFGGCISGLRGQAVAQDSTAHTPDLQQRVEHLESEVKELRAMLRQMQSRDRTLTQDPATDTSSSQSAAPLQTLVSSADRKTLDFLHDTTLNLTVDGYYAYNFNNPVGRVNLLRAYDVLSNEFSLNQASTARPPTLCRETPRMNLGRRFTEIFFKLMGLTSSLWARV